MDIKELAVNAARKAGSLLRENLGRAGRIEFKGAVNIVTELDKRSEALIVGEIKKAFPDHGILAEESLEVASLSSRRWIIDPLDGTTNYAHGLPVFCVSIAFEEEREVRFGAVYNPMLDEMFTAGKGAGAYMNGVRLSVSKVNSLNHSLLATGFPYDLRTSRDNNFDHFSNFSLKAQAIRRAGAAALDLSYTAAGRFDGFWEMKLKPWDVAAAALILKEAGGTITDFKGAPFSTDACDECLASNGLIHKEMLEVLSKNAPTA